MVGVGEIGTHRSQSMGKGVMDLEMLIWRQVTPRWVNDPVWLHDGGWESGQGRVRAPPPPDGKQAEVR